MPHKDTNGKPEELSEKPEQNTLGDFRIIREIGRGGMGVVYEAEQISLRRSVAIKVLFTHLSFSKEAVMKFRREAEAGGRQRHPGIVSIYAVGEEKGVHYIAQELIEDGRTLAGRLVEYRSEVDLPIGYFRDVAKLIADVAEALHDAHTSGVIHRDIKPSNILITKDGTPKVTDFGLARVEDALVLSRTGDFAGTPYYMSPEQAASRRIGIDHRTDIFSLGVTLYEMLTLVRPFGGDTSQEVLRNILLYDPREPWKLNPRVPHDLAVICLKAMEKKPDARYATMADFAGDLKRYLAGEVILAKPAGALNKFLKRLKRNPVLSLAVGAALAALIALILYIPWVLYKVTEEHNKAMSEAQNAESLEKKLECLSDYKLLTDLLEKAEELWPAYPDMINSIDRWLEEAYILKKNLDMHRTTLKKWKKQPRKGEDPTDYEWRVETLQKLITDLEAFSNVETGNIKKVEKRLEFARRVREDSIVKHMEMWEQAKASIANPKECPKYNRLPIKPQLGLVPIGQDPESGLWEFLHLQTGDEKVPKRGSDGKLQLTKDTGLVFVLIPGGAFDMGAKFPDENNPVGSPNVDPNVKEGYYYIEGPVHHESVSPFFISKYEMTQGQWIWFTGRNPSEFRPEGVGVKLGITPLNPVENVSWKDCNTILNQLGLRLPEEKEWEYAARAGTSSVWWIGNNEKALRHQANVADQACLISKIHVRDWPYEEWNDGWAAHAPVGTFKANDFGLHNIIGNLREWCKDVFRRTPSDSHIDSSSGQEEGIQLRVFRGGDWVYPCEISGSSYRAPFPDDFRFASIGVRPARSLDR